MSLILAFVDMAAASALSPLESSSVESGVTEMWSIEETQHLQNRAALMVCARLRCLHCRSSILLRIAVTTTKTQLVPCWCGQF